MSDDFVFAGTKDEVVDMLRAMQAEVKAHPELAGEPRTIAKIYMVGGRVVECDVFILNTGRKEIAYHEIGKSSRLSKIPFYDVERWEELP
jgi:hypothetical protein